MKIELLSIPLILSSLVSCTSKKDTDNKELNSDGLYTTDIEKPNFVFILTEDISCDLPMYGDSTVHTPALEKLAKEGIVLTNAYTTSGTSAPSRSSIITGMYPISIGTQHMRTKRVKGDKLPLKGYSVVVPPHVKCFTEFLRSDGYYCTNKGKRDWNFKKPISAFHDYGLKGSHWRNRPKDKPFFSIFNIHDTHESMIWRNEDKPLLVSPDSVIVPPYYPDIPSVREDIARSYSNIIHMDKEVGEILHELEKDQLLDSTFVIFVSDHGGPLPRQKREVIDAGLHVPMIVRFPKAKYAGTFDDRMFSFVDFAPSFLSLANIDIPDYIQGKAFWGKDTKKRKYIFGMRDRIDSKVDRVRSVHDGRFVYVKNYYPEKPWYQDIEYRFNMDMMQKMWEMHKNNQLNEVQELWFAQSKPKEQLFDLKNDPYEINNIADMDSNKARLDTFRKVLNEWLTNVGDMGTMTEYKMVKEMWPDFKQPITEKPVIEKRNDSIYISCPTEGASIVYQVTNDTVAPDTTEPNNWCLYDEPVKTEEGNHVHAVAIRIGYKQSYLNSYNYNEN